MRRPAANPWANTVALTGGPALDWRVHSLVPALGLGQHRTAWDALRLHLWGGHPLLSAVFVDSLLRNFGGGTQPKLCIASDAMGEVCAMCLLEPTPARPFIWRSFLPPQMQIGPTLVDSSDALQSLFKALPRYVLQVDLMCNDPQFGDLVVRQGRRPHSVWHSRTTSILLDGDLDQYWAERPTKLRQNVRRYQRRLTEAHGIRFVALSAPADITSAVVRYSALEAAGWKGRKGTAVTPESRQLQFYSEVLVALAQRGGALVCELWAGPQLIASRLSIVEGHLVVMLKTAYNEGFAEFAPGNTLLALMVEHLFKAHPGKSVEFYTNATREQQFWSTQERDIRHLSFYRHDGLSEALHAINRGFGRTRSSTRSELSTAYFDSPADLPADAVALFETAERATSEASIDWFVNYCQTVRDAGARACFHVLLRGGHAVAVLPVAVTAGAPLGQRNVDALGNFYTALYVPPIDHGVTVADLAVLVRAACSVHRPVGRFRFSPMDSASREFTLLRGALEAAGLFTFPYLCFGNWYLLGRHVWVDYLAQRSGQIRSALQRYGKKFRAAGGRLEIITGGDRLEAGIAAFEQVYSSSWKRPEPYPDFMAGLMGLCARRGWLRLGVAWLADKPVAAQLWIVSHGRADIYKLAYDEAHKVLSAGTLLTGALMQQAMDLDQVKEIDYLIGDDAYKAAWMGDRRERWGLVAYNARTLGGALGLVEELVGRAVKPLRKRWASWRAARASPNPGATTPRD